ncbi:transposase [Holdemanella biformis]|uniref:transposase n=1 Tax=Holdemanella biformis TaxID=1735 RepID=UPI0022E18AF9|nr:transposase [Holdemanella biformis]
MYKVLFDISAETIKELSKDKKYLGAKIGFTSVLHTWGQNLSLHPHIHMIVPGGGIFLSYTKKNFDQRKIKDKEQFQEIINSCYSKDWVVYTKKPMKSAKHVVKYLGRYTHRIAISNARLKKYENNKVTFSYKDYSDHNQIKKMTLDDT